VPIDLGRWASLKRRKEAKCPSCGTTHPRAVLDEALWYPFWKRKDGGCPACVQRNLLRNLLEHGEGSFDRSVQSAWPLDAEAAFGAIPTPLRLRADPRFTGRGVTLALVDSGFYPHPDLVEPRNRILAGADATRDPVRVLRYSPSRRPVWPKWHAGADWQWHGLMTSVAAAGNGRLSHGLYAGLASEANLVLIQGRDDNGRITNATIVRALRWLLREGPGLGVRVVSLSVSGDPVESLRGNPVDEAAEALIDAGITVVAAAGNAGERRLLPPATAPRVLTIGGIDDHNSFRHDEMALWHSNYGEATNEAPKPELVAPSLWVAAPILPGTTVAREAMELFERRRRGQPFNKQRLAELKLITPFYQHVEGTSFAAPLVSSAIACMLQANPKLTPLLIRQILTSTAEPVPGAPRARQGAGALAAGAAVARALMEHHGGEAWEKSPSVKPEGVVFRFHDHDARLVEVCGSWNAWVPPGVKLLRDDNGLWHSPPIKMPRGAYIYKFVIDGKRWMDDPANPRKVHDGVGGMNSVVEVP
jgi:serine protease AprX